MDDARLALALAAGRVGLGGACTIAPRLVARQWVGGVGGLPEAVVLARALGARDLLLGLGALNGARAGRVPVGWLAAGAAADAVDAASTLLHWSDLPKGRRAAAAVLASTAAAAQLWLVSRARRAG